MQVTQPTNQYHSVKLRHNKTVKGGNKSPKGLIWHQGKVIRLSQRELGLFSPVALYHLRERLKASESHKQSDHKRYEKTFWVDSCNLLFDLRSIFTNPRSSKWSCFNYYFWTNLHSNQQLATLQILHSNSLKFFESSLPLLPFTDVRRIPINLNNSMFSKVLRIHISKLNQTCQNSCKVFQKTDIKVLTRMLRTGAVSWELAGNSSQFMIKYSKISWTTTIHSHSQGRHTKLSIIWWQQYEIKGCSTSKPVKCHVWDLLFKNHRII